MQKERKVRDLQRARYSNKCTKPTLTGDPEDKERKYIYPYMKRPQIDWRTVENIIRARFVNRPYSEALRYFSLFKGSQWQRQQMIVALNDAVYYNTPVHWNDFGTLCWTCGRSVGFDNLYVDCLGIIRLTHRAPKQRKSRPIKYPCYKDYKNVINITANTRLVCCQGIYYKVTGLVTGCKSIHEFKEFIRKQEAKYSYLAQFEWTVNDLALSYIRTFGEAFYPLTMIRATANDMSRVGLIKTDIRYMYRESFLDWRITRPLIKLFVESLGRIKPRGLKRTRTYYHNLEIQAIRERIKQGVPALMET